MKKIVFGLIGCFFIAFPPICLGETDWYGKMNPGVNFDQDSDVIYNEFSVSGIEKWKFDTGYSSALAFGYKMEQVRLEGEVSYGRNEVDSVDGILIPSGYSIETSLLNFMFNGYYDFNFGNALTPYLTAGAGFSRVEADINMASVIDDKYYDTVFAYQIGAGLGYAISEIMTLNFRYRFLGTADPVFSYPGGTAEAEIFSHNLTVGIHMAF
ncbi:MAG: outer membrane beta-barrel protein [Gammaproteobacteria bacterium]|nr:outer membrane beta-barrel protein [Gammaproteobacteria bacterium]